MMGAVDTTMRMPDEVRVSDAPEMDEMEEIMVDLMTGEATDPDAAEEKNEKEGIAFEANLAELLEEDALTEMGTNLLELVKVDIESRKDWYEKLKKGLERLGIYDPDSDAETGITKVSHPMLMEAATQFQARAMTELLPPGGPVKSTIEGEEDEEIQAQAKRVERYMNYQLTIEDRTYYDERDQMLFLLPFTGSEFDKQFYDHATERVLSRWVRCDDFIVPYNCKTLEAAPRYTHAIRMNGDSLRGKMASGFYIDCDLSEPTDTDQSQAPLTEKLQNLDGQEKPQLLDVDKEYTLYEIHVDYDVSLDGVEGSIKPYTITVDSELGKVLSIYRNWRESDRLKRKRVWFSHKKFLPGFGFYGFGLLHAIGNLGDAASEILRILIDSGAFATLQGGFKSIDAKIKGDVTLTPGEWVDTEMTFEELEKAFYTPPWKEPSPTLEKLLGVLVESGQKFASTTETMTGDAATTGPVGTMVAQIEQGSKVFSGIHKRLHKAFGDEFIHIAELNGQFLPDSYPYRMASRDQHVLRQDFDDRIDIVPVSDPNIFSSAQRIAMMQAALQMATQLPDLGDRAEAARQLLTAMRFPNPERIFPKRTQAERADPLSEGSIMLMGRPIRAYVDQDHPSHITVHMGQMQGMLPQYQPLMQAHIAEHMAMEQFKKFATMGIPLPPLKWDAEAKQPMMPALPPQLEAQIAVMAAQAMQKIMAELAQQQAMQPKPGGGASPAETAEQRKQQFEQGQQQRQQAFEAEQARRDQGLAAKVDREDALQGLSPALVKEAQQFIVQTGLTMSPRELAVLSKALGAPFAKVVEALSLMQMAGQGGSQFEQTDAFINN